MEPNYNPFEPQPTIAQPKTVKRNMFEVASVTFAIGAFFSCIFIYGAYFMGSLAILFALLSRGNQMKLSSKAKIGLLVGIFAIILSTLVMVGSIYIAVEEFGSIENALREYCQMFGLDFEQEFGILFQ